MYGKLCDMLKSVDVEFVKDSSVEKYKVDLNGVMVNPYLEVEQSDITDMRAHLILKEGYPASLMAETPTQIVRMYFEYQIMCEWVKHLHNMVEMKPNTRNANTQVLSDVLTRLVKQDCPKCVLRYLYHTNNRENIVTDKFLQIYTAIGMISGLWDAKSQKYVPVQNQSQKSKVSKLVRDFNIKEWEDKILDELNNSTVYKQNILAVGLLPARNKLHILNPIKIITCTNMVSLFLPRIKFTKDGTEIEVGVLSTHKWKLVDGEGEHIHCYSPVRHEDKEWDIVPNRAYVMSQSEVKEELSKLLSGSTDNILLRCVNVDELQDGIYHLHCKNYHVFVKWFGEDFTLLAGMIFDRSRIRDKVTLTEDEDIKTQIDRCIFMHELAN